MNRLRTRLLAVFLAATLVPVAATLAVTWRLLEHSITLNSVGQLDAASQALQLTGRALYQASCEALRGEAVRGKATVFTGPPASNWPPEVREFAEAQEPTRFHLAGERRDLLEYLVRDGERIRVYSKKLAGPGMKEIGAQYTQSRAIVERASTQNLRRGFILTLIVIAAVVWIVSFAAVLYLARRISLPIEELTSGLGRLADGDLGARLDPKGTDEVVAAMHAFNHTASELQESQAKLVHVTRLSSWQSLARKMAHELKNSLTPIRLTVEEIAARRSDRDDAFFDQAAQIVVDEIGTLERRVRAFTEFSAEPPMQPEMVDMNALFEERFALLRTAHPEIICDARLASEIVKANVDPDLVKGVLTNLLDNAAYAAGAGGVVMGKTFVRNGKVGVEIHDSGPGLSAQAKLTLFEPTISFKKSGMGLGLSIAKRSAILVGGDILLVEGELGGAAFRVLLPGVEEDAVASGAGS